MSKQKESHPPGNGQHEEDLIDAAELERKQLRADEAGDAEDSPREEPDIETVKKSLEEAQTKADETWDKYVRLQAEMENLRRRSEKQVEDAHKYAIKGFVESLLPVIDSLEMGMSAEGDLTKIREGMELTLKQFMSTLQREKVEVVDPLGEAFNPDLHQAISMQPSKDHEENTVIHVMQKGYTLNERLVRPAMVVVCKN